MITFSSKFHQIQKMLFVFRTNIKYRYRLQKDDAGDRALLLVFSKQLDAFANALDNSTASNRKQEQLLTNKLQRQKNEYRFAAHFKSADLNHFSRVLSTP